MKCKSEHNKDLYHQNGGGCSQWRIDHSNISKDAVIYCECNKFEMLVDK